MMTQLLQYSLRVTICFAVMYLFYALILKKLTFYKQNRWYLLGYSLLSFVLPVLNISSFMQSKVSSNTTLLQASIIQRIPQVSINDWQTLPTATSTDMNTILVGIIVLGAAVMLTRLLLQYISLWNLKRRASLISEDKRFKLYQVNKKIVPFSFGKHIFINQDLHNSLEIPRILEHEFVHVKEHHTWDILWSELLIILNWYNPFVWLIRKAIRENLEFIADNEVVRSGIDKKQYQYLLLRVMGSNNFSITNKFNFSSLKKRIMMMNKSKTTKIHLFKFLFLVPLLGVLLVSFRKIIHTNNSSEIAIYGQILNGATDQPLSNVVVEDITNHLKATTNEKGHYSIHINPDNAIKVPLSLKVKKQGFENFTMPIRSLKDKNGNIDNNLYMLNVSLQPKGQSEIRPTSVFLSPKVGTERFKNLKRFWDRISAKESLSVKPKSSTSALSVSGIVVDASSFRPLSHVLVKSANGQATTTTDAKGFFTIDLKTQKEEENSITLLYSRKGYQLFKSSFSHMERLTNDHLMDNIGLVAIGSPDTEDRPFSAFSSQESVINYNDANEAMKSYIKESKIEQQLSAANKVIVQQGGTLYIIGHNIRSSYTVSPTPQIYINGKLMTIKEVNSAFTPDDIRNISSKTPDKIEITVSK